MQIAGDQMNVGGEPILFDVAAYERTLAPWAERPSSCRGRPDSEDHDGRTPHQRDRDRIIHATAFRRLKHKTQVFVAHEGDHHRTRLTHTLEVAQITRSVARALRLNEDLAEAIALAHDLGHPPFGHAGERALDRSMAGRGGFDHNMQSLRVVTMLERRTVDREGLNLTWEALEGLAKHNGPSPSPHPVIRGLDLPEPLSMANQASLEAQVAALADDIAYNAHDIDDGLRAGLFTFEELHEVEPVRPLLDGLSSQRLGSVNELLRRQITMMIRDVVATAARNIQDVQPRNPDDVRLAGRPLVQFSPECRQYDRAIRSFLRSHVYEHPDVTDVMGEAETMLSALFQGMVEDGALLSSEWRGRYDTATPDRRPRIVTDYIAGMTDPFARDAYRRLATAR